MSTKGLEGVIAATTHLSRVRGEEGRLTYAGYEIEDLAENASFEEVCHLLLRGSLPNRAQLASFTGQLNASAALDPRVLEIVRTCAPHAHPMAVLRTAISACGVFDADAEDRSPEASDRKAVRLTAQAVTITAAIARFRQKLEAITPRTDLGLAANFLYMLRGEEPADVEARTLDIAFVLHAEHGMNASTFAARVAAGTLTDMHSAVVAAIGTLKGPLHGGANEGVMKMLLAIGSEDAADAWVRGALARGERIMGFGHRVYRTTDPRAPILKSMSGRLQDLAGDAKWLRISERVQAVMREEMEKRQKAIYPNVDFFSASVYYTMGIPLDLFTNIFACARMPGWTAHIIEQQTDNRLIRPGSEYAGPDGLRVDPIDERA
jgi:2-methylcitrate synthase